MMEMRRLRPPPEVSAGSRRAERRGPNSRTGPPPTAPTAGGSLRRSGDELMAVTVSRLTGLLGDSSGSAVLDVGAEDDSLETGVTEESSSASSSSHHDVAAAVSSPSVLGASEERLSNSQGRRSSRGVSSSAPNPV